jgi:hypothetical protein
MASRVGRGIALPFLDRGIRRGWVVNSTPPTALYPRERTGTHCRGGWVGPRASMDSGKSRPTGIRSPDCPARSSVAIPTELPGPKSKRQCHIKLTGGPRVWHPWSRILPERKPFRNPSSHCLKVPWVSSVLLQLNAGQYVQMRQSLFL